MLDSLGSTLQKETIDNFFIACGKTLEQDLTMEEVIHALEVELTRPESERKEVPAAPGSASTETGSMAVTPSLIGPTPPPLESLNFAGHAIRNTDDAEDDARKPSLPPPYETEPMQQPLVEAQHGQSLSSSSDPETPPDSPETEDSPSGPTVERVINIRNCPLCHRPRLSKKAEVDIVTHLAVCASGDWGRVDSMITGNYVTASQAGRKWYTKVLANVTSGSYSIGAVRA
jgi:phosphatidylserine decarboxylase